MLDRQSATFNLSQADDGFSGHFTPMMLPIGGILDQCFRAASDPTGRLSPWRLKHAKARYTNSLGWKLVYVMLVHDWFKAESDDGDRRKGLPVYRGGRERNAWRTRPTL